MIRTLLVVVVACWAFSACSEPCVVVAGDCPNNCSGGPVGYGETCSGPSQCQCGLFCQGLTKTCAYYTGENRGCLCGGVSVSAPGLPVLGSDTHSMENVELTVIGTSSDGLRIPRDLEFNPEETDELWVANRSTPGDERMVVFSGASSGSPSSKEYSGPTEHFFAQPSAIAFGAPDEFASIHETNVLTQGPDGPDKDFMGPTLQSTKPEDYDAGGKGHLDMLHNTPLGMGIAWERDRVYWIFDGFHDSITMYNFMADHGPGGTDHKDGIVHRYVEGDVKRKANVPSHMEFDPASSLLYIADTGTNRIATLDTTSGTLGSSFGPNRDGGTSQYKMSGATLTTLVDGAEVDMSAPSGLALYDGLLYVTDNETSKVLAFDPIDGALIDWLDTGLPKGSLMGIEFGTDGSMWLVDAVEDRILRITAKP